MRKLYFFFVLALLIGLMTTTYAYAHKGVRHFRVDLKPLNGSGVSGQAYLELNGDELTVKIDAEGLEMDQPHAQHIHGFDKPKNATCPTEAADTDGDGLVSVGEGLPNYGPILLPLTLFQTAPDGTIEYQQTFTDLSSLEPVNTLQNRAIVLHGLTVNGSYEPTLPVACGQIRPAPNRQ